MSKDTEKHKKDYSLGEESPYWNFLSKNGMNYEPIEANPDGIMSNGLWYREEATEEQKRLIKKIFSKLTKRQKQVLELIGYEGKTFEYTAVILGVSKGTVQKILEGAQAKIRKLNYGI